MWTRESNWDIFCLCNNPVCVFHWWEATNERMNKKTTPSVLIKIVYARNRLILLSSQICFHFWNTITSATKTSLQHQHWTKKHKILNWKRRLQQQFSYRFNEYFNLDILVSTLYLILAQLCRNKSLSLDVESHLTNFNQIECFISAWYSYVTLKFDS